MRVQTHLRHPVCADSGFVRLVPTVACLMLHGVLPVMTGALIYLSWRSPTLLVFRWAASCGLTEVVNGWRYVVARAGSEFPDWFLYSVPDALWAYGLTTFMTRIWRDADDQRAARLWIYSGVMLGCGGEVGQLLSLVAGTFDLMDIILSVVAAALSIRVTSSS